MNQSIDDNFYHINKKNFFIDNVKEYNCQLDFIKIGSNSRRRVVLQVDKENNIGFFQKRSHDLIDIEGYCSLLEKEINNLILILKVFLKSQQQNFIKKITLTMFDNVLDIIFLVKNELSFIQQKNFTKFAQDNQINASYQINFAVAPIYLFKKNQIHIGNYKLEVASDIFLQASKLGLENIIKIIRKQFLESEFLKKKIVDIYSGCGFYAFALNDIVKEIHCYEGLEKMANINKQNCSKYSINNIKSYCRDLFNNPLNAKEINVFEAAIINPPRNGASPQIIEIAKSKIKLVIYVSCDIKSFKRDAKILIDSKFKITNINAVDQFYLTDHIELIATFVRK